MAVLGLCCCAQAVSSGGEQGLLSRAVCRLPVVVASLVAVVSLVVELGLYSMQALVVLAHRLSSPTACGIFLD